MQNILRAKCILLGDSCTGKTALLHTFLGDGSKFIKNYHMTAGVDVQQKVIKIPETDTSVQLFFYDTSGKEFYADLVMKMSQGTSLALVLFDVTSEGSLARAESQFLELRKQIDGNPLKGILLGTKTDLKNRRRVSPKLGHEVAKKLDLTYLEVSTADNTGIEIPFFYLANEWYKTYIESSRAHKISA